MKKFLSMILAIVMVASMVTVFAVNSNATEGVEGLTVTLGTTYATAGSTAWVDVYVKAAALPAEYVQLRDWQFIFEGATVHEPVGDEEKPFTVLCYPVGSDYGFVNYGKNQIGNTCDSAAHCAEAAQVLCKGGVRIASVLFDVPAGATGEIAVTVSTVDVMHFQNATLEQYDVVGDVTVVAGKIKVVDSLGGYSSVYEGAGESYVVPTLSTDGKTRITSMWTADPETDDTADIAISGEFDTLVIPAAIVDAADCIGNSSFKALVLKNTAIDSTAALGIASNGTSTKKVPLFILSRPNGTATTEQSFNGLTAVNRKKVDMKYLLQPAGFCLVNGVPTFIGGIAADDLDFYNVAVGVKITYTDGGVTKTREFCTDTEKICHTVVNNGVKLATTDEAFVDDAEVNATAFTYISGASITGMPAGDYTAEVTFYGTTDDANGFPIVVCGNTETYNFTI